MATQVSMSVEEIEALPKIALTYKHRILTRDQKVAYLWQTETGEECTYRAKLAPARPGLIFEFPTLYGTDIFIGRGKWTGKSYEDVNKVIAWQTADRVFQQEFEAKKRLKVAIDDGPLQKAIMKIRLSYKGLRPQQRNHFIAWLVEELNK